jgi:hypothetical protein
MRMLGRRPGSKLIANVTCERCGGRPLAVESDHVFDQLSSVH